MPESRYDLIGADAITEYLGVCRMTAYTWIRRRGLPVACIGQRWRASSVEIDIWIGRHQKNFVVPLHRR